MNVPGLASIVFLTYLLVVLPWAVIRGARRLRTPETLPSREKVWLGTLLSQVMLLFLAWMTGRGFDYRIFALPSFGTRVLLAFVVALAAVFALRAVARALRSEDARRKMIVYRLAPRTPREWTLWTLTVLVASVAEEAAYRGVAMSILWYTFGSPWIAVIVCSIAFAMAHWVQGWKSAVVIFAMALLMHGLVQFTGTLVLAMVVHATYDFVTGYRISRERREMAE